MSDEFETVATFHDLTQAQAARAALDGEGLSVQLLDETTGSIDWGLMPAMGGLRLQVPRDQAPRARKILDDLIPADDGSALVPEESGDTDDIDSAEEARYRAASTKRKRLAGRVALLLLFLPTLIGLIFAVVSWLGD